MKSFLSHGVPHGPPNHPNFSTMGIEIHDLRSHHGLGTTISRKRCHPRVGCCSNDLIGLGMQVRWRKRQDVPENLRNGHWQVPTGNWTGFHLGFEWILGMHLKKMFLKVKFQRWLDFQSVFR